MHHISSSGSLTQKIKDLENARASERLLLDQHVIELAKRLSSFNIIKETISDALNISATKKNWINIGLNIASGYLAQKIMKSSFGNKIQNFLGLFLQAEVIDFFSKNNEDI